MLEKWRQLADAGAMMSDARAIARVLLYAYELDALCIAISRVSCSCFPSIVFPRTHIPRDACFPAHISLGMRVSHQ